MRDAKRIDFILYHLREVWRANPDLRLGQLLVNVVGSKEPCPGFLFRGRRLARSPAADGLERGVQKMTASVITGVPPILICGDNHGEFGHINKASFSTSRAQ